MPTDSSRSRFSVWGPRIVRAVVAIVIVIVGAGIFSGLANTREEAKRTTEPPPPRLVRTMVAQTRSVPRMWSAYGTARALRSTEIAAEVSAVVRDRPVEMQPGVRVDAGEMIVRLDPHDFEQAAASSRETIAALEAEIASLDVEYDSLIQRVELAEESVALAREELDAAVAARSGSGLGDIEVNRQRRSVIVLERDATSQRQQLDQIPLRRASLRAQILREQSNLRLAARNLERAVIRAPYSGRLQRIDVQEGERVSPGSPVARLVDLSRIEVPLRVAASAQESVRVGDRVSLRTSGDGSTESWSGRVTRISPEADADSRTFTVFAVVEQDPDADGGAPLLLPGRFVLGRVEGRSLVGVIPVPRNAITEDRVLVMNPEGVLEERDITVRFYTDTPFPDLSESERQWAIVSGELAAGERVVTSNLDELDVGVIVTDDAKASVETARAGNGESEG